MILQIPRKIGTTKQVMTINKNDCRIRLSSLNCPSHRSNFGRGRTPMSLGPHSCSTATYFPKRPVPPISSDGCLRTSSPTLTVSSPADEGGARLCVCVFVRACARRAAHLASEFSSFFFFFSVSFKGPNRDGHKQERCRVTRAPHLTCDGDKFLMVSGR